MQKAIIVLSLLVCMAFEGISQQAYSGLFEETAILTHMEEKLNWEQFEESNKAQESKGYRLADLETLATDEGQNYWAVWEKVAGESQIEKHDHWPTFAKRNSALRAEGYALVDVEAFQNEYDATVFVGVWRKQDVYGEVWKLGSLSSVTKKTGEATRKQLVLVDIEAFKDENNRTVFLAVYHRAERTQRNYITFSPDQRMFMRDKLQRNKSGYELFDYERIINNNGKELLVGLYRKGNAKNSIKNNLDKASFQEFQNYFQEKGFQLIDLEVNNGEGNSEVVPEVEVEPILSKNN